MYISMAMHLTPSETAKPRQPVGTKTTPSIYGLPVLVKRGRLVPSKLTVPARGPYPQRSRRWTAFFTITMCNTTGISAATLCPLCPVSRLKTIAIVLSLHVRSIVQQNNRAGPQISIVVWLLYYSYGMLRLPLFTRASWHPSFSLLV